MGVTGLWTVVQPCARPIKIETLNRKRLAVDASLWIYAFLKAVRDKEGNALRNSHVVGFYRRICKLLFIGILPVFVFDGGAPALKRQTINSRKQRREGRREDAVRTAGKLLALQMQRRAEEEDQRRREAAARPPEREEEEVPDVYVDELYMTEQERLRARKFKKKDQYHLPDLDVSLAEMGQPNDPRVMSLEELEQYARQFDSGEDINVYDFSKIDFNSPFFQSLPPSDRYNILNAARLRSRLRMGLSKDQLDNMFPDRMAFSRFQIERVKERNELTQRLMHVNGMGDDPAFGINGTGRVAGEKGREYVLVKNAGVEGGWALGVIGDRDGGDKDKPIDVDEISKPVPEIAASDSDDSEDAFEDVPIEGLNRLPKLPQVNNYQHVSDRDKESREILARRTAIYQERRKQAQPLQPKPAATEDPDSLFIEGVPDENADDDDGEAELQRAIAMSLENGGRVSSPEEDDFDEVFPGSKTMAVEDTQGNEDSDDEAEMEFENVLGGPFTSTDPPQPTLEQTKPTQTASAKQKDSRQQSSNTQQQKFDGPLPFEKLDLGSSILGRKKMKKLAEDSAGGFEKNVGNQEKKQAPTLPPWFSGDLDEGIKAQKNIEKEDRQKDRAANEDQFVFQEPEKLLKDGPQEVIDVDALDDDKKQIVNIDSSDDEDIISDSGSRNNYSMKIQTDGLYEPQENSKTQEQEEQDSSQPDLQRLSQSKDAEKSDQVTEEPLEEAYEWEESDKEDTRRPVVDEKPKTPEQTSQHIEHPATDPAEESAEEEYEWEASDQEDTENATKIKEIGLASDQRQPSLTASPDPEFEDVNMADAGAEPLLGDASVQFEASEELAEPDVAHGPAQVLDDSDDEVYGSDVEDEELLLQMATEAEEHERFASTLNSGAQRQSIEEYERELKSLRSQQKKDRRDADEVTNSMITECQQLLKLFGLPYITAPMEAEAQCAELVSLGLVDGIVTDDSDIFLFGGTRIYKNMFNQSKFVECYLSADLEREFDLTREKMIRIAHLLGSDYTDGIPGVGPVTALEIISEFPSGLDAFNEWWTRVQTGAPATDADHASPFRRKFRRNSTKLFLPTGFPDRRVDHAYLNPEVDSDPSPFQWGVPDLDALRAFLMATVGWSQERTDEVLVPVIRDMNRRQNEGTQVNITRFLGGAAGAGAGAYAPRRNDKGKSKRMEGALEKLAARARANRKAGGKSSAVVAAEKDEAVQAEEAIVEGAGSAVGNGAMSSRTANGKSKDKTVSKRKAVRVVSGSEVESEEQETDKTPAKRKKAKSKKR